MVGQSEVGYERLVFGNESETGENEGKKSVIN